MYASGVLAVLTPARLVNPARSPGTIRWSSGSAGAAGATADEAGAAGAGVVVRPPHPARESAAIPTAATHRNFINGSPRGSRLALVLSPRSYLKLEPTGGTLMNPTAAASRRVRPSAA